MLRGKVTSIIASLFLVSLVTVGSRSSADEMWNMATAWGGGPFLEEDAKGFAELVKTLTNGRIQINVFPGGMLGSALKVSDTVRSGVVQAGHSSMGYDWGIDKATLALSGGPGHLTPEEFLMWLFEAGGAELWFEYRKEVFGIASIPCQISPTEIFLHSTKKVETIEDMQGLKLRTAGAWAEIAGKLGASTVILPGAEVYPALERGVVDAIEWSSPAVNLPSGFHKIAKYIIIPGLHATGGAQECAFNLDVWNGLSVEDQELLKLAGKMMAYDSWSRYAYRDIAALKTMREYGNEFVILDDEFIRVAAEAAREWEDEEAAENPWFKRILDHRRVFEEDMSNWPQFRFQIGKR